MFLIRMLFFLFGFLYISSSCVAQQPKAILQDSTKINEALLLREQQQNRIDSLVKVQLQRELAGATGNVQKTKELEAKLRTIAVSDSLRRIAQIEKLNKLKKNAKGYPIVLNRDTLFNIFTRTGSFNAKDRARAISLKITKL